MRVTKPLNPKTEIYLSFRLIFTAARCRGSFRPRGTAPSHELMAEHIVLARAGDFDAVAMRKLVEKALGPWKVAAGQPAEPPAIPNPPLPPQSTAGQVMRRRACSPL